MINPLVSPYNRSALDSSASQNQSHINYSKPHPLSLKGSGFVQLPVYPKLYQSNPQPDIQNLDEIGIICRNLMQIGSRLAENNQKEKEFEMLSKLVERLEKESTKYEGIDEQLNSQKQDNQALLAQISEKTDELQYWKENISEIQKKLSQSSHAFASVNGLQMHVECLMKDNEKLNQMHHELREISSSDHQAKQLNALVEQITNIQSECQEIESTIKDLHSERLELLSIIEQSKLELNNLTMKIPPPNIMTQEKFRLQYINKSLEEKIVVALQEKEKIENQLASMNQNSDNDEFLDLNEENEYLKREIESKNEEIENLKINYRNEVEDFEYKCENFSKDNENLKEAINQNMDILQMFKNDEKFDGNEDQENEEN